jgi:hypothetical protein
MEMLPLKMPLLPSSAACSDCHKRSADFVLAGRVRCVWCFLRFRPMLRKSLATAVVVGSILTAINQGTVLLGGEFPAQLYWKIPLTYCVPFCVATWGALINSRIRSS